MSRKEELEAPLEQIDNENKTVLSTLKYILK
jgi:hypothetical protein